MKNLFFLAFILLSNSLIAQDVLNTYLDAKKLAEAYTYHVNNPDKSYNVADVLSPYTNDQKNWYAQSNPFYDDKLDEFLNNPAFIILNNIIDNGDNDIQLQESIHSAAESQIKRVESLNFQSLQSSILQGTADFMAERFKQEVSNYALTQFFETVESEEYKEQFEILFPNTAKLISKYMVGASSSGYYTSDLNLLRFNSEIDIRNMPTNLIKYFNRYNSDNDIYPFIIFVNNLIDDSDRNKNPLDIFDAIFEINNSIDNSIYFKELEISQILINALRADSETDKIWVKYQQINPERVNDDLTISFFYILLHQQIANLDTTNDILGENPKVEIIAFINKTTPKLSQLETDYDNIKSKEERTAEDYKTIVLSSLSTIDIFIDESIDSKPNIKLENTASTLFSLHSSISEKNYQFVLSHIVNFLFETNLDDLLLDRVFFQNLNLILDFTMIDSSEKMKDLLNSYLLPIGSSSLKRTGRSDISINGYVGALIGYETVFADNSISAFNVGLTAPIGISISRKWKKEVLNISSRTWFIGVLDLGSLVNNSLNNEIATDSNVKFEQFFVPSLGYFVNFRNSPFTLGTSMSYHFGSREIDVNTQADEQLNSLRFNLSFLVDIPFLTLKHKSQ